MAEAAAQQNFPVKVWKVTGRSVASQVYPIVDATVTFTSDSSTNVSTAGVFLLTNDGANIIDLTADNWVIIAQKGLNQTILMAETDYANVATLLTGDWATVGRILRVQLLDWQQTF